MTFARRRNRLTTHFSESIPAVKRRISVLLTITSGHFTYQTHLLVSDGKKESITPSSKISLTLIHFMVRFTKDFDIHGSVHRKCIFQYNQRDATLHNVFISVKCSICFGRALRPSSGVQKLYTQHRVFARLNCYLSLSWKSSDPSTTATGSSEAW
jgi:hypothetical protein